jgi:hypothetical protein
MRRMSFYQKDEKNEGRPFGPIYELHNDPDVKAFRAGTVAQLVGIACPCQIKAQHP